MKDEFRALFSSDDLESPEAMTAKLIDLAQKKEHSKFKFIRDFRDFRITKILCSGIQDAAVGFDLAADQAIKNYYTLLSNMQDDPRLLLDGRTLVDCAIFWRTEAEILKTSIAEYKKYLSFGNFFRSLLGHERTEEELVDYTNSGLTEDN